MKLMVNVCGHNLCESCVELLFVKGSGSCPECNIPLRRGNFRLQLFEDASIDKEVDIRRRILKDFNKQQEDFVNLREFNDYLEMVEDIIYNLTNNIDILETNKKISIYKEQNKDNITKNRSRMSKDALEIEDLLAVEQKVTRERKLEMKVLEEAERVAKIKNKEKLIDDLMFGERDAARILEEHREAVAREEKNKAVFSTGDSTGQSLSAAQQTIERQPDEPYAYCAPSLDICGPPAPSPDQLVSQGFTSHIRAAQGQEKAGGYLEAMGCYRAVQDAMAGLFFVPGQARAK